MATFENAMSLDDFSVPAGIEEPSFLGNSAKPASPASTTSSVGTKRKRATEPKFYAVRVGYHPGIYHSWSDCLAEVTGFKNATFKSFTTLTDAESFLAGGNPSYSQGLSSSQPYKFYAVQNGRVPGVYLDWPSAQKQIVGWTKPKHKCFASKAEAEKFVRDGQRKAVTESDKSSGATVLTSEAPGSTKKEKTPAAKKPRKNGSTAADSTKLEAMPYMEEDFEPGTGPLPPGAEDGFDPNIFLNPVSGKVEYKSDQQRTATKAHATGRSESGMLRIYTDGSSLSNGAAGARAGVGVYFGPDDDRNLSEPLPPQTRHTNQRAELTALQRALEIAPRNTPVTILTDSKYAIDCVTVWYLNWRRNGWVTAAGKTVENRDVIENVLAKIEERASLGSGRQGQTMTMTRFEWVKGHAASVGNGEADRLAVAGARMGVGVGVGPRA